jgi:hypothetical protein
MTTAFALVGLLLAMVCAPVALISQFDLPLMPGLTEQADSQIGFDKAEGRILATQLDGPVALEEARNYYRDAALGLGWSAVEGTDETQLRFARGADRLTIDFFARESLLSIRLLLEPAGN